MMKLLFSKPKFWLKTALISGLFIYSVNAHADHVLQDYVNQLKNFSADFEQTQPDEAIFELNQSFGHFKLQRPGKLVWRYTNPNPQHIVVDGVNLWVYDLDLEQVTVRPIDDVKAEIPLSWLLYDDRIESRFMILEAGHRYGMQWYNLTPKQATYFQSIEIGLKDGKMQEVWMYQSADNVTKVKFKNIQQNQVIPASTFVFKMPKDVDLVGTPQ